MGGGDAGCALGDRRDGGERDSDQGGHYSCSGRSRYRLRYDGGADDAERESIAGQFAGVRTAIEKAIPHGRTDNGGRKDKGGWRELPKRQVGVWRQLQNGYKAIIDKYPKLNRGNDVNHLGTLGTGNHFIEVCLDESDQVWFMLHSGSRGVGNRIGMFFIDMAKNDMRRHINNLPDKDLAYFAEGSEHFEDYFHAVSWAQEFAFYNRKLMMEQ